MREAIRQVVWIFLANTVVLMSQTVAPAPTTAETSVPQPAAIPKHMVYTHFLAMIGDLDQKANATGETNPYKFAEPFALARFDNSDLDVLRAEARALTNDLATLDRKAKVLIDDYRQRAKAAAGQGKPLPLLPIELSQLQAERTAVSVNHMMTLQTSLGKEKTAKLEAYFARDIAPHVSIKVLAHPPADPSSIPVTSQSLDFAIQH